MGTKYSITLADGNGGTHTTERASERAQYVACVVITHTAASVAFYTAKNADDLARARASVVAGHDSQWIVDRVLATAAPVVGREDVCSWHSSVDLAVKATSGRDAGYRAAEEYTLSVRTDIVAVAKAARAAK